MKIALVHDWLTGYRGGEKVLEALCQMFPQAPLYTLFYQPGCVPQTIEARKIHTSFLNRCPLSKTHYRHYLPLFPLAAETLIDQKYDLIISTSHAVAKSIRTRGALHWCYIHSPMRYVWDRFDDYFGPERVGRLASSLFFSPLAAALRCYDRRTSGRVNAYVANSEFVANRVRSFYAREAEVIHPPVEVENFANLPRNPQEHYLFFSALVPYKRADLAILACQKMGRKLKVIGDGPELPHLQRIADPKWIEFLKRPSDETVKQMFSSSRALIFPAVEDFGIVPVEATAAGLPVIGLSEGGLLDSQTPETCLFFKSQTVESLIAAMQSFENQPGLFEVSKMRKHAESFSRARFKAQVKGSLLRMLGPESKGGETLLKLLDVSGH